MSTQETLSLRSRSPGDQRGGESVAPVRADHTAGDSTSRSLGGEPSPACGPLTGQTIGEYEVGSLVGTGGNAQVYRAYHRLLDKPVALKILIGLDAQDLAAEARFRREAAISSRLNHPHLIHASDAGKFGDSFFLVQDFVAGVNLETHVQQHGPMELSEACRITYAVADVLGYLAGQGIVHRDIKPSNIMLDTEGHVWVLDLGIARLTEPGNTLTESGQVIGTLDFMAPEQATDPQSVDSRADIYSLGCTFYYLLTGHPPHDDPSLETAASRLFAQLEYEVRPISEFRGDVPYAVIQLIECMLQKDPELRPHRFDELSHDLARYLPDTSTSRLRNKAFPCNRFGWIFGQSPSAAAGRLETLANILKRVRRRSLWLAKWMGFVRYEVARYAGEHGRYGYSNAWVWRCAIPAFVLYKLFEGEVIIFETPDGEGIIFE